jgi:transcription-repair coupling factor (superfamily II helicase)
VSLDRIRSRFAETPFAASLRAASGSLTPGDSLRVRGAIGSTPAFAIAEAMAGRSGVLLAILPEHDSAAYLQSDLEQIIGGDRDVLAFPPSGNKPYDHEHVPDSALTIRRADVIQQLQAGFSGIVVTSAEALLERVPPRETVASETLTIRVGDMHPPDALLGRLVEQGFEVAEFVELPGEVALRGGILDAYPFAGDYPVRLEYFGDEIDSIREFDPQTQRSISRKTHARLVPDLAAGAGHRGAGVPFTSHLPPESLLALFDAERFGEIATGQLVTARAAYHDAAAQADGSPPDPEHLYLTSAALAASLAGFPSLLFGTFSPQGAGELVLEAQPQPPFNSDIRRLKTHLAELKRQGFDSHLLCDSASQRSRLRELLAEPDEEPDAHLSVESLHEGFLLPEIKLAVFTDHQVFNRYHRPTARKRQRITGGLSLRDLKGMTPGDYVVHVDHGVGRFSGLHKIRVRETLQEAVRLEFLGGDELFVNVGALHKLHKYTGKEGHQPRLTKLGSGQWERVKARTKKRVKDIARDLIQIYARRKASPGYSFSPDSTWQREMEASFRYEDTPDQALAAAAVKEDMEQPTPMDRLVCGDVGFGKTEIAVRAAFKAVQDGRQAAVLVPTTLLAMQHHATFTERLERYPVRIAQLSRLVLPADQKETLAKVATGEVDIIIGTQRLAGKSVGFKDLGLLVIDEEQRFGVAVKERLRKMRSEVDTLTLTATPIPRTLQFSLLGVRDLSIISTPPANRQPVQTEIHTFDKDLIRDAILYEVNRAGQVFFIHNRVQTIDEMAALLRALVPDVRIRAAHGQMKASDLEAVMEAFVERQFDVLVATNIVESGLDIANANTIIINHAERFGLSDMHQLRGRVGRSDVKAFCYLLVPSIHTLTREARMRLQAVEEFADLGSGFAIAMRDLDIRGAGALLGAEQSGFIQDLGYETYHKILEEAVSELREEEFAELFDRSAPSKVESVIDVEGDAFIPAPYVSNSTERMNLYRRLADVQDADKLDLFRQELVDRFGPIPREVDALLTAAAMKPFAESLRLPRVTFKNKRLFLTLPDPGEDAAFYERDFQPLLARLETLNHRFALKEGKNKRLRAIVQDVPDLPSALTVLDRLQPEELMAA